MTLNLALALVAAAAALFFIRETIHRLYAIGAIVAALLVVLLQLHLVIIRFEQVRLLAWAVIAVLGTVLLFRQTSRNGGAAATAMVFSSAIPLARIFGFIA